MSSGVDEWIMFYSDLPENIIHSSMLDDIKMKF
jgi:hypothetical protein